MRTFRGVVLLLLLASSLLAQSNAIRWPRVLSPANRQEASSSSLVETESQEQVSLLDPFTILTLLGSVFGMTSKTLKAIKEDNLAKSKSIVAEALKKELTLPAMKKTASSFREDVHENTLLTTYLGRYDKGFQDVATDKNGPETPEQLKIDDHQVEMDLTKAIKTFDKNMDKAREKAWDKFMDGLVSKGVKMSEKFSKVRMTAAKAWFGEQAGPAVLAGVKFAMDTYSLAENAMGLALDPQDQATQALYTETKNIVVERIRNFEQSFCSYMAEVEKTSHSVKDALVKSPLPAQDRTELEWFAEHLAEEGKRAMECSCGEVYQRGATAQHSFSHDHDIVDIELVFSDTPGDVKSLHAGNGYQWVVAADEKIAFPHRANIHPADDPREGKSGSKFVGIKYLLRKDSPEHDKAMLPHLKSLAIIHMPCTYNRKPTDKELRGAKKRSLRNEDGLFGPWKLPYFEIPHVVEVGTPEVAHKQIEDDVLRLSLESQGYALLGGDVGNVLPQFEAENVFDAEHACQTRYPGDLNTYMTGKAFNVLKNAADFPRLYLYAQYGVSGNPIQEISLDLGEESHPAPGFTRIPFSPFQYEKCMATSFFTCRNREHYQPYLSYKVVNEPVPRPASVTTERHFDCKYVPFKYKGPYEAGWNFAVKLAFEDFKAEVPPATACKQGPSGEKVKHFQQQQVGLYTAKVKSVNKAYNPKGDPMVKRIEHEIMQGCDDSVLNIHSIQKDKIQLRPDQKNKLLLGHLEGSPSFFTGKGAAGVAPPSRKGGKPELKRSPSAPVAARPPPPPSKPELHRAKSARTAKP